MVFDLSKLLKMLQPTEKQKKTYFDVTQNIDISPKATKLLQFV